MKQDFTMIVPDLEWSGIASGEVNILLLNHRRWHFGLTKSCDIKGEFIKFTNEKTGESIRREILEYELSEKDAFKDFILVHLDGVGDVADGTSEGKLLDIKLCLHTVILKELTRVVMLEVKKAEHVVLRNHEYLIIPPELSSRIKSYQTDMIDKTYNEWIMENNK